VTLIFLHYTNTLAVLHYLLTSYLLTNLHPSPNQMDLKYKIRIRQIPILAGSMISLPNIPKGSLSGMKNEAQPGVTPEETGCTKRWLSGRI